MAANSQFSIAVHVLTILARGCESRIKSEYFARSVNTNPVVIRRLLKNLQEAGFVVSQVGASGGTCLAKLPKDIRLSDIYKSVSSGEIFALAPNKPSEECPVGKNIESILCNLQREIDHAIDDKLRQYTLRDVIEQIGDD